MHDGLGMEGGKSTNWRRVKANQPISDQKTNFDQSQIPIVVP